MLYPVGHERTGLYLFLKLEYEDNSNNRQIHTHPKLNYCKLIKYSTFFHFAEAVKNLVMR